jgi:multiple sugar transport system permease protein
MRKQRTGWLLLVPTLVILFITGFVPFLYVLWVGFFDWNPVSATGQMNFTGVNNFRRLMFDGDFLASLGRTVLFMVTTVTIELSLGFALAGLLIRNFPGKTFFRTIHTLPLMVAPIVVGAVWKLLVVPGIGPIPFYLRKWFGFDYNIGTYASHAFWTTVIMDVWHWTPFVTLTILAGLSAMPKEPFESARVDGANRFQQFRFITVPLLMPMLLTTMFLRIMDALRIVDEVFMLNGGGPGAATRYVGIHIWRVVFPQTDYGYGSAMSLLLLYFTILLCWFLFTSITQSGKRAQS